MRAFQFHFILFILLGSFSAYSYSTKQCQTMDWSQKGYEYALDGKSSEEFYRIEKKCLKKSAQPDGDAFKKGWNKGKEIHCSDDTAFNTGLSGKRASGICPSVNYQKLFQKGSLVRDLNDDLESLSSKLKSDQSKLTKYKSKVSGLESSILKSESLLEKLNLRKTELLEEKTALSSKLQEEVPTSKHKVNAAEKPSVKVETNALDKIEDRKPDASASGLLSADPPQEEVKIEPFSPE